MIRSPLRSGERILTFGPPGVGKTKAYLDIALRLHPDDTMYVIETDPSLDRMLDGETYGELAVREEWHDDAAVMEDLWREDGGLVVYHADTWPEARDALAEVWGRAGEHDWIVVDSITMLWDWVQNWYWETVAGVEQDEFLLEIRKQLLASGDADDKKRKPNEAQFNEWSYINPHFAKHVTARFANPPRRCNLYLTAEQADVVDAFDKKDKATWGMYGSLGVKPKAQKRSGYVVDTMLQLGKLGSTRHRMTTVKDRERAGLSGSEWTDFVDDYLVPVAGWNEEEPCQENSTRATPSGSPRTGPSPKKASVKKAAAKKKR